MNFKSSGNQAIKTCIAAGAALASAVLLHQGANAGNVMSAGEISELVAGNTVYLEVHEAMVPLGAVRKIYFDPSGRYQWDQGIEVYENSWQIREGDRLCYYFLTKSRRRYKEDCGAMLRNGDGTFTRIEYGRPVGKVLKVVRGKAF